jgi:hypothetical protein
MAINEDTLEALFGFIDFEKFKSQMLSAKKGIDDDSKASVTQKAVGGLGTTLEDFKKLDQEDLSTWTKKLEEKKPIEGCQIKVHQRKNPGQKVDIIRCDAVMKNVDLARVLDSITNTRCDDMIKEVKVIEKFDDGQVT